LVDLLHFEGSSIEVAVLPLELRRCGIVFSVLLAADGQSVDEEVLELVNSGQGVLVKHAEIGEPSVQDIVCKDVKLALLRLELQHMDRFLHVSCVDAAVMAPDLHYRRLEVLVIVFAQQLLLAHFIDAERAADTADNPSPDLVEGRRNLLARGLVEQVDGAAILRECVCLYPCGSAAPL